MSTDFQGFGKTLFNNQLVNMHKYKRFVIINCAAISQNLTENVYGITKKFTVSHSC